MLALIGTGATGKKPLATAAGEAQTQQREKWPEAAASAPSATANWGINYIL